MKILCTNTVPTALDLFLQYEGQDIWFKIKFANGMIGYLRPLSHSDDFGTHTMCTYNFLPIGHSWDMETNSPTTDPLRYAMSSLRACAGTLHSTALDSGVTVFQPLATLTTSELFGRYPTRLNSYIGKDVWVQVLQHSKRSGYGLSIDVEERFIKLLSKSGTKVKYLAINSDELRDLMRWQDCTQEQYHNIVDAMNPSYYEISTLECFEPMPAPEVYTTEEIEEALHNSNIAPETDYEEYDDEDEDYD